jgi:inosine-uridine nucleoside N-ribohydrolase
VNTFYGRPDIPIGAVRDGKTPEPSPMLRAVVDDAAYPRWLRDGRQAPEATGLLRSILAAERDGAVVFVQVGFSTNLARLLDSKPDGASPLAGRDLVARKARLLSAIAGHFPAWDPTAALYAVRPDRGYFSLSPPGRVTMDAAGRTIFTPAPDGQHRYLMVNEVQRARTLEAIVALASQPPR